MRYLTGRVIALLAIAAIAVVPLAALAANHVTAGEKDDLSGWVEAVSTMAALGAAVAAALFVARTVHIELEREEDRLQLARQRQAELVAAWPVGFDYSSNAISDDAGGIWDEVTGIKGVKVAVRNASPVPVTALLIEVAIFPPGTTVAAAHGLQVRQLLPPDSQPTVAVVATGPEVPFGPPHDDSLYIADVTISFMDAAGLFWRRDRGGLSQVEAIQIRS